MSVYQANDWKIMKDRVQRNLFYGWDISAPGGLEPGTARSVGQRLTNGATGAPPILKISTKQNTLHQTSHHILTKKKKKRTRSVHV